MAKKYNGMWIVDEYNDVLKPLYTWLIEQGPRNDFKDKNLQELQQIWLEETKPEWWKDSMSMGEK